MGDNSIYLYWEIAGNTACEFIIVERSTDETTWHGLKTIVCSVSLSSAAQFFYVDAHLQSGKYYYRLKLVSNTGSSVFSNIALAEIAENNTDIFLPETGGANIQLFIGGITNTDEWDVTVLSTAASLTLKPAVLKSNILKVPEVHSGAYLLKLQNRVDGSTKTIRFFKK